MPELQASFIVFSAGEASGDRHAAALFSELQKHIPHLRAVGMGGKAMQEAGIQLCYNSSHIGVIGLIEIAQHYCEIRSALRRMKQVVCDQKPDLLICVDYKEFNFRLAKAAKKCGVKVLFYVSPQVWAWRPDRVKEYGKAVDHMAVIFPFEVPFYEKHGIPVTYVGHPLAKRVKNITQREVILERLGIHGTGPIVGLLPGSRMNEMKRLFPIMIESAKQLASDQDNVEFFLFQSPSLPKSLFQTKQETPHSLRLHPIHGLDYDALRLCDVVITASGTATLEVALAGVPMVIVYRLHPISYEIARYLVNIPWIGLPNILARKSIVREYIQYEAISSNIVSEVKKIIMDHDYRENMRRELGTIREIIGEKDGTVELAKLAIKLLTDSYYAKATSYK